MASTNGDNKAVINFNYITIQFKGILQSGWPCTEIVQSEMYPHTPKVRNN